MDAGILVLWEHGWSAILTGAARTHQQIAPGVELTFRIQRNAL